MTSASQKYIDLIDILEDEHKLEVIHRKSPDDNLLYFKSIFSLLSSFFADADTNHETYHFGWRKTLKIIDSPSPTYIKAPNYELMTKQEYLKPIGYFYNVIKSSCSSERSKVCILAASGIAFHTCLLSCNISGAVPVLINSMQTNNAILNALEDTQPSIILVDNRSAPKLLNILKNKNGQGSKDITPTFINNVNSIVIDETDANYSNCQENINGSLIEAISHYNDKILFHYFNITKTMEPFKYPEEPIFEKRGDDHVLTIYTSGSTAEIPKGVLVTNNNLVSGICTIYQHVENFEHEKAIKTAQPRYLSYLPLSHVFELLISYNVMLRNGIYAFGNPKTLSGKNTLTLKKEPCGDFKAFKPNFMCAVPLVLSRIKVAAEQKIQSEGVLVKFLYHFLLKAKERKVPVLSYIANAVFFNKIKEELGGGVLAMISGGAFLLDSLKQWAITALDVSFCEGYALTETCAVGLYSLPFVKETKGTYVGVPTKQNKAIITKKDEYYKEMIVNDRRIVRGSLLLEGVSIPNEYVGGKSIKNGAGMLETGDIVEIQLPLKPELRSKAIKRKNNKNVPVEELELGIFKIVGREKENVKLSNGEFYNLVYYESIYRDLEGVKQCMIYVNKEKDNQITLILNSIENVDVNIIRELEKDAGINDSIRVRKVVIIKEDWSLENGCLTPTLKLKRFKIIERYQTEIENNGHFL